MLALQLCGAFAIILTFFLVGYSVRESARAHARTRAELATRTRERDVAQQALLEQNLSTLASAQSTTTSTVESATAPDSGESKRIRLIELD